MVASIRTQVLLKPKVLEQVKAIAERDQISVSNVLRVLVDEALAARGVGGPEPTIPSHHLTPDIQLAAQREAKASENGWTPQMGIEAMDRYLPNYQQSAPPVTTQSPEVDNELLALAKKLKLLKEMNIL